MKGNQLPDLVMKWTRIPTFDEFFEKSSKPLEQLVSWNNSLDDQICKFRKLGADVRKLSKADAPEPLGTVKLEIVNSQINLTIVHKEQVVPESKLDKVSLERLNLVKKKIGLLHKRLATLKKRQGFENANFKVGEKDKKTIELSADKDLLSKFKDEDDIVDMGRSIVKFNNRVSLLDVQLAGNVTLEQAISALLNSLKDELKKRAEKLKISVENGVPEISGLPDDVEGFLPDLVARAWKLFKSILDLLKKLTKQVPALLPEIETAMKEGAELPGKLKDAATSANLGGMEILKAGKNTSSNIKTLGSGPTITKTLSSTVNDTLLEIAGVFTKASKEEDN
eukprot:c11461_g1_i1.p1 GENE.c11461_g1_i1~~c11461_g1_i1.p1  ORF type:complete len:347 (-),score=150.38 c11461_g1_i1:295-1308(-)